MGASNIFFVFKTDDPNVKEIVTPDLEDLILPGVTRDSIIVKILLILGINEDKAQFQSCGKKNHH